VAYASTDDVKARLGRDLTSDEQTRFPGLLEEASAIVDGYLGRHYTGEGGIPDAVRIVVSRLIARALRTALPEGMTSMHRFSGPCTGGIRWRLGWISPVTSTGGW
jgi:hypothetical protein